MKDVIVIAIVVGFFALCVAYVTWCERILTADAPDRIERDAQAAGRDAHAADAPGNQMAGVSPDAGSPSTRQLGGAR